MQFSIDLNLYLSPSISFFCFRVVNVIFIVTICVTLLSFYCTTVAENRTQMKIYNPIDNCCMLFANAGLTIFIVDSELEVSEKVSGGLQNG